LMVLLRSRMCGRAAAERATRERMFATGGRCCQLLRIVIDLCGATIDPLTGARQSGTLCSVRTVAVTMGIVGVACLLATGMWGGTSASAAAPRGSTRCGAPVVSETLTAPSSAKKGATFTARAVLHNCTGRSESFNLEGRLTAPAPCNAPVIDPLRV